MPDPLSFSERRKKLLEEKERQRLLAEGKQPEPPKPDVPVEDIPDVLGERSENDIEMDRIIGSIKILDAYRKWIGKEVVESTTKQVESVKISCPFPDHRDKKPSAWINQDKNVFTCGTCGFKGGDVHDLAAIHFGFPMPGYKQGAMFHELREKMAESYGWQFKKLIDGSKIAYQIEEESEESEVSASGSDMSGTSQLDTAGKLETASAASPQVSGLPAEENGSDKPDESDIGQTDTPDNVAEMWADDDDSEPEIKFPTIEWRDLADPGTFIYEYCLATSNDSSPEEYHLFHSLLALAHAVGKRVYLDDTSPVYGNMLICLLGGTGYGKSRSRYWLDSTIREVLPFVDNGLDCTGTKIITPPASGEHLIKSFQHIAHDPSLGKNAPTIHTPVNGIVDFDEFAALLSRANRQGSTLKPTIMGLADARPEVSTGSLTSGDFKAIDSFCSITASTQPKAIRTLLSKTDTGSGFLNRWIFVGGRRKEREVLGGARSTTRVDLDAAKDALKGIKAWGSIERKIHISDEGFTELEKFYKTRIFPLQDSDDTDLLKRLDLLFKRFILLFCINERKIEADLEIVKKAESMLDYIVFCYGAVSDQIGITQMTEISAEILRHIKRHHVKTSRGASTRDLQKYMRTKNYGLEMIKRTLETMVSLDMIELEKKASGPGRPSIRYKEAH